MVKNYDKMWSTGEGNDTPLQLSCLANSMTSNEKEKEMTLKDKPHKVSRYTIYSWKEQKNSSRRNEEAGPQQKQRPVVDVSGGESKLLYCKAQYCIGTEMLGP